MEKQKRRITGLDLIRFLAVFCVISVHFFLNNGFYNTEINGSKMFISVFMRWTFFICVPLFLLLTGYLNKDKKINKKYYKGLVKILVSYLFIATICLIFRKYYLNQSIGHIRGIVSIFNFKADEYAWYVEMYIGLFLIIPFLNVLYNNLKNIKEKQYLILIMLILTSVSPVINCFVFRGIQLEIFPNWWTSLYPITYYFIGMYISEFKVNLNKLKSVGLILILVLFQTLLTFYLNSQGAKVFFESFDTYGNLITLLISTLVFITLYQIDIKNKTIKNSIALVSTLSFDIYLFSYILDKIVYPYADMYLCGDEYLAYYIIIVLIVFIGSLILAYTKKILFDLIKKITVRN